MPKITYRKAITIKDATLKMIECHFERLDNNRSAVHYTTLHEGGNVRINSK
jgi:hypothetical protein